MGVQDAHDKLFSHVKQPCRPRDLHGKKVAIDLASFKLRAFSYDARSYFRPSEPAKYGYKATIARMLSTWTNDENTWQYFTSGINHVA